jgi:hypothetical protein
VSLEHHRQQRFPPSMTSTTFPEKNQRTHNTS